MPAAFARQFGGFRRRPHPIYQLVQPQPPPTYLQALSWTGTSPTADAGLIVDAGDLDLEGTFTASIPSGGSRGDGTFGPDADGAVLFQATTPEGDISVHFEEDFAVGAAIYLKVRGVDAVQYKQNLGSAPDCHTVQQWRIGDEVYWRAWYRPSTGSAGFRFAVNGTWLPDFTTTTSGGALAAATAVTVGTSIADGTKPQTLIARFKAQVPTDTAPEFMILGDSTLAPFAGGSSTSGLYPGIYPLVSVGHDLYTSTERWTRPGIGILAVPGDTTNGQNAKWQASVWKTKTTLKAAIIQVGVNDSGSGEVVVSGWLQTLVNQIRADRPDVKILIAKIIPYGNFPGANLTFLFAYNDDIAGTGAHPITGVDARIVDAYATLDNGSGGYKPAYDYDGEHENNPGRAVIAGAYRAALHSLGLI